MTSPKVTYLRTIREADKQGGNRWWMRPGSGRVLFSSVT